MNELRVSEETIDSIRSLIELPMATVEVLVREFSEQLVVKLGFDDHIAGVIQRSEATRDLPEEAQTGLAEAIARLYFYYVNNEVTQERLACQIALASEPDDATAAAAVESKIRLFLSVRALETSIKAISLINDYHRIYLNSRVVTDIRPVFDDDLSKPLQASLVLHTINLTVRTDGVNEDYFVVADSDDVRQLIERLQRSLDKAAALKKIISGRLSQELGPSLEGFDE